MFLGLKVRGLCSIFESKVESLRVFVCILYIFRRESKVRKDFELESYKGLRLVLGLGR